MPRLSTPARLSAGLLVALLAGCASDHGSPLPSPISDSSSSTRSAASTAMTTAVATAAPVTYTTETASPMGRFYDSLGINIHLNEVQSPYHDFTNVQQSLQTLGFKHFRDSAIPSETAFCSEFQQLGTAGMRGTFETSIGMQPSDFESIASCVGPNALDTLEAPNEYDITHPSSDTNWSATMDTFMAMMHKTMRQSNLSQFNSVAIIGPSFASSNAYSDVGDLSSEEDYGNMHDYFAGRNPGTGGWGSNGYGSIPWNLNNSHPEALTKRIIATETGYGHADPPSGGNNIPSWNAGLYSARLFFEQFNAGIPQTYLYELYDEPLAGGTFTSYGLQSADATPQSHWAFYALSNLASLVKEPYRATTSASLTYSLTGQTSNIHHTLLQKADGSLWLAIWLEVQSVDPNSGVVSTPSPQSVTVDLQSVPKTASYYSTLMTQTAPTATTLTPSNAITISVADQISFLRLTY